MSDRAIVGALGAYLKAKRLDLNITQAQLANNAGLNRWTLTKIEKGESINLVTLIQILRALDELHLLDRFQPEEKISPIEYAKLKKNRRQRAKPSTDNKKVNEDLGW